MTLVDTIDSMDRMAGRKRSLMTLVDKYKMDFDEDEYVSHPEDPSMRDDDEDEYVSHPEDPSMRDDDDDQIPPPDDDIPTEISDDDKTPPPKDDKPKPRFHRAFVQTIPPNDAFFKFQWALQKLWNNADANAQEGWKAFLSATNGATTNKEVIVAVIDTGVLYDHEDLKNNMWKNPGEVAGDGKDKNNMWKNPGEVAGDG